MSCVDLRDCKCNRMNVNRHNAPNNAVSGHDELGMTARRVRKQFTLCLNKHVVTGCQLHAIDSAQVGPDMTHCTTALSTYYHCQRHDNILHCSVNILVCYTKHYFNSFVPSLKVQHLLCGIHMKSTVTSLLDASQ